jgi:P-type conjugative transfer protein TrbJ
MNRLRRLAFASIVAITVSVGFKPSSAQLIVFDPNNYAQNVLTAARALQQINNQIVSLQNQALLAQAQRIAYDIQQIDRAFSTTYAPASSSVSDQALIANAQSRWQNAMSGFQDAMRTQATVVGNLDTNRTQMSALVTSSQGATGALQASQAGNQLLALAAQQLGDLTALVAAHGRAQNLESAQHAAAQDQGREQLRRFLTQGAGYQSTNVQMFH